MAVYNYNISCLNVVKVADPGITSRISPAGEGQIALADSRLVQAPVHKSGAVEGIWPLGSPYVRTAKLGGCDIDQRRRAAGSLSRIGRGVGSAGAA